MSDPGFQFGKKVFFLNPPGVLSDVASTLSAHEFEVYLVHNHRNLARFLKKEPQALVFVNIDEGMSEPEWEAWIRGLQGDPETASVGIGVVTLLGDPEISRKYLMDVGISCGFVTLKIGASKTADILLKTLEANEARGRRKYVRASCPAGTAEFSVPLGDAVLRGTVQDLSTVGMAAWFESAAELPVGTRLKDLQLTLRGARILLNGIIVGKRTGGDGPPVQVIMFEPGSLADEKREKIRSYIRRVLQDEVNRRLESA